MHFTNYNDLISYVWQSMGFAWNSKELNRGHKMPSIFIQNSVQLELMFDLSWSIYYGNFIRFLLLCLMVACNPKLSFQCVPVNLLIAFKFSVAMAKENRGRNILLEKDPK